MTKFKSGLVLLRAQPDEIIEFSKLYSTYVKSSCSGIYFINTQIGFSCNITLDSPHEYQSPHFQINFSSFSEFSPESWCYLSIISGEKLIFFFEVHRELYCVGKKVVVDITKVYQP